MCCFVGRCLQFMILPIFSALCLSAVQTFNSCTSRPDVWQCLVVHTPTNNMSGNRPTTSMKHVAYEFQARISCEVIYTSMPREIGGQSGVRSWILPGLPRHIVQELKVGTVRCPKASWLLDAASRHGINKSLQDFPSHVAGLDANC